MSIPTETIEGEMASSVIDHAVGLLSQQIWCWGRDILRSEGNWLLHQGFTRLEPPWIAKIVLVFIHLSIRITTTLFSVDSGCLRKSVARRYLPTSL